MVRTIWPSRPMRTNALGAKSRASSASASHGPSGRRRLSMRPPPAAAPACRKPRRERPIADDARLRAEAPAMGCARVMSAPLPVRLRGQLDRVANPHIGAAATDVAGHRIVDVGIAGMRIAGEQRRRGHDLAGLAVAALNDLAVEPRLLDLRASLGRPDGLDGRDLRVADAVDGRDAGTGRSTVDMD